MTKKQIKKILNSIEKVEHLEDKRKICQEFSDLINAGINFKIVDDEDVEKSFLQVIEAIANVRYS